MSCSATGGWLGRAGFDEFARGEEGRVLSLHLATAERQQETQGANGC